MKVLSNCLAACLASLLMAQSADCFSVEAKLTASDPADYHDFGRSVSISGDLAISGAIQLGQGPGFAYIFARNAGGADNWGEVVKLTASDAAAGDYFGVSVSISGDLAIVGASLNNDFGSFTGSAYFSQGMKVERTTGEKFAS